MHKLCNYGRERSEDNSNVQTETNRNQKNETK
jgi:hypothetical protein